jgi:hypothetical protein
VCESFAKALLSACLSQWFGDQGNTFSAARQKATLLVTTGIITSQ